MVKKWYDLGLRWIKDIINENGEIRPFQELKQNFKFNGHFLTYAKLLHVIPKQWKRIVNTAKKPINLDIQGKKLSDILSNYRPCKYFYNTLKANEIQLRPNGKKKL